MVGKSSARRPSRCLLTTSSGSVLAFGEALRLLAEDPCQPGLGAYRLSGPLKPKVCGAHLRRGYRIAFTMQPPVADGDDPRVVILYVGKREPHQHGAADIWEILHDLFGIENPPSRHEKPPCCADGLPELEHQDLDEFLRRLRRFRRGR